MIAAFLRTDDGTFDYVATMISLVFVLLISWTVLQLYKALRTGRILFGVGYRGSPYCNIERENNSSGFWLVFALYSLSLVFYGSLIVAFCFGLLRKSG